MSKAAHNANLRERLYVIIFGTETPAGRAFDIALLAVIVLSILVVMLESESEFAAGHEGSLRAIEWSLTILFTIEYATRLYCARRRLHYALSFFGFVDLLSLLPTYLSLIFANLHSLLVIRVLRLLRVFRVLKIVRMSGEANALLLAIRASIPKITVFVGAVITIVVIIGAAMHLIEGADHGFTSIPRSMYWAIVTLTTVGYGDIAPATPLGRGLAALLMIVGYGMLAVPTGIVSAEFVQSARSPVDPSVRCSACSATGHRENARYCHTCGSELL